MKYNPDIHNRHSIRLSVYDYSQAGVYFVTICTQNRACLFGDIVGGKMKLNDAGRAIEKWYRELENKFPDIQCDEYVVMPNHFHGIVINVGADLRVCPGGGQSQNDGQSHRIAPTKSGEHTGGEHTGGEHTGGEHTGSPLRTVVQWFKTMTTNEYIRGVKQHKWPRFDRRLWQRNYYEHIVRNKNELNRIRQYIIDNPAKWEFDRENPTVGEDLRVCPDDNTVREPCQSYGDESWMK